MLQICWSFIFSGRLAQGYCWKMSLKKIYLLEKKLLRDAPAKLCSSCLDLSLWTRTMQVPIVLRFYYPHKADKIDRLIHRSVVKQLLYFLKLFRVTADCIHSFRTRSKEKLRIMYPKNPFFDFSEETHPKMTKWQMLGSIINGDDFSQNFITC